jgi:hypothetical protein
MGDNGSNGQVEGPTEVNPDLTDSLTHTGKEINAQREITYMGDNGSNSQVEGPTEVNPDRTDSLTHTGK